MNTLRIKQLLTVWLVLSLIQTQAQTNKSKNQSAQKESTTITEKVNPINGGMPNRISMNVTVPKQTQGATFGEKVNAGLATAKKTSEQEASLRGFITGSIAWNSESIGSATNAVSSVGNLSGAGGGAAAASYAATGMVINPNTHGVVSVILAREAGSGMATGRRQYQPVFNDVQGSTCTDCPVLLSQTNPYFVSNGMSGEMPLLKNKMSKGVDDDCDGVEGLTVSLVNEQTGVVIASVKTERCGDFFFENLPKASYIVKLDGAFLLKKSYDFVLEKNGAYDIAGELLSGNNHWTIKMNTGMAENPNGGDKVNAGLHAAGSALSQGASLLGGALPGGAVISAAVSSFSPGDPIPGLDVKLGKNPGGGNMSTANTNEKGQFEFTGLSQGNYTLSSTFHFDIDGSIPVNLWLSKKGYDYYKASSDTNAKEVERKGIKENGIKKSEVENPSAAKGKKGLNAVNVKMSKTDAGTNNTSEETQRKGWDGTVKGSSSVRSNTQNEILKDDDAEKIDNSALTTAIINLQDFKNSLVDLEKLIEKDKRQSIASNKITTQINNVRNRINELENSLKNLGLLGKNVPTSSDLDTKLSAMEGDFFVLLENLGQMGDQYSSISNVLKTKHDTAKNSVGNIR
ncbi:MAG: carboxypeptidase regulatory-like domain-containing protein [Gelidibacter sp.]|nr:carboxypeptidase regulatory-like domain-containing protein [Gelidibacter sp.]